MKCKITGLFSVSQPNWTKFQALSIYSIHLFISFSYRAPTNKRFTIYMHRLIKTLPMWYEITNLKKKKRKKKTLPCLRSGNSSVVTLTIPPTFTLRVSINSWGVYHAIGPKYPNIPALFTIPHRPVKTY